MEWQPIETAPKDGTTLLLAAPGNGPVQAEWSNSVWLKGWYCGGSRSDMYGPDFDATHWMPLPAPPL